MMKLAMTTDPNGILVPFVSENIQVGALKCGVNIEVYCITVFVIQPMLHQENLLTIEFMCKWARVQNICKGVATH